ncbi:MAG TPA: ATP-binding protein [Acidimicrobiales bacterium]|nr:ATP-binding protein [Acidimicrobiales bacterium]
MADEAGRGPAPAEADLRELARALSAVLRNLNGLAQEPTEETLADRLAGHLGADPRGLPVLSHEFPPYQLVDVQVALDAWVDEAPDRSSSLVGVAGDQRRFHPLSELLAGHHFGVGIGPVEYLDVADSPDSTRSCVRFGIFLLDDGGQRAVALLRGADPHGPMRNAMLEIISADPDAGRRIMAELRRLAVDRSVLRGQVLALGPGEGHQYGSLRFMHRPDMDRDSLVLPDSTLTRIERHVIGIAAHGRRLEAAGQHLKRGVLLYGPPGTGKTHTVRYLLSRMAGMTAFILSGQALGLVGQACGLARVLQPSLVVLEDIDLIAGDRSFGPVGSNPLLFEVLNQIDGLGDDVDVTFLLTTNRVDILERALAERPGRVDAAVEVTPPDHDGRRRLLRLYGAALGVEGLTDEELQDAVAATDGRTATYLREVVRRAALLAADEQPEGPLRVDGALLGRAAAELLGDADALTRALLGGAIPAGHGRDGPVPAGPAYQPMPGVSMGGPTVIRRGGLGQAGGPRPFAPE